MQLLVMLTARCNAGCGHCSTNCGPQRTEHLSRDKLFSLLEEAARLSGGEPLVIALTGGEPFLDFELLLDVIRRAARVGAAGITCVTNAYWATSAGKARALVAAAKEAGLTGLGISTSRFHEPFVKRSRVEIALQACRDTGLDCGVKYVRGDRDAHTDDSVIEWARTHGAGQVEVIALMPALRDGVSVAEAEYRRPHELPQGPCPASVLTVREHGAAFTCGAPGADTSLLALGNVHEQRLEDVRTRFLLGGVQQVLRQQGPAGFARAIVARGAGNRLRARYAGVCDLCIHIARDPVMAPIARDAASPLETSMCEQLVERLAAPRQSRM